MAKYLIEVNHAPTKAACEEAVRVFLNTGSHFLTNAEWGCMDEEHTAWFFLETNTKEEALSIVPPAFRKDTRVIKLARFEMDKMDDVIMPIHED